jgi:hypothetical protein
VLDVLRVCQVAAEDTELDPRRVRLVADRQPDEFLIASHLLSEELPGAMLDDACGHGPAAFAS